MQTLYQGAQGPLTPDSFRPTFVGGTTIAINPGSVVINGTEGGDDQGAYIVQAVGTTHVTLSPANSRTDWIIVRVEDEDYSGGTSTATLEVIEGIDGSQTLPPNSFLIAAVSFIAGEFPNSGSVVDRRGSTVYPGPATSARGLLDTGVFSQDNPIAPVYPPQLWERLDTAEVQFTASQDFAYELTLNTGEWHSPQGADRSLARFAVNLSYTNLLGNPVTDDLRILAIQPEDLISTGVELVQGIQGTISAVPYVFPLTDGWAKQSGTAPLRLYVKEVGL